ncbi:MAG: S8 family serine peptidase, partial [Rhodobacteraceae bacterium]|nr:S8 family serine peptidase [Paracoccaceae bacterium]
GSNWGAESVDLMVPAERIELTDHRGATVSASGSSYAVPRVAALAARLLERHPDWKVADLIVAISGYAAPGMDRGPARVKLGWIPDPRSLP